MDIFGGIGKSWQSIVSRLAVGYADRNEFAISLATGRIRQKIVYVYKEDTSRSFLCINIYKKIS
jgi:hypothetical protein